MKVSVKTESFAQNSIKMNEVRLKLHFKKSMNALMILGALSLLLFVIGISTGDQYTMINMGTKKIYYNLNLFTALGISIILVLLYVLRQMNLAKKNYLKAAFQLA